MTAVVMLNHPKIISSLFRFFFCDFCSGNGILLHRGGIIFYRGIIGDSRDSRYVTFLYSVTNKNCLSRDTYRTRKREMIHGLMAVIEFRILKEVMGDLTLLSRFTCVSVSISDVATSNLFGLLRYLFCRNCFSNSRSCWDVKAVLGLLVLPSNACCAAQPITKKKYYI